MEEIAWKGGSISAQPDHGGCDGVALCGDNSSGFETRKHHGLSLLTQVTYKHSEDSESSEEEKISPSKVPKPIP